MEKTRNAQKEVIGKPQRRNRLVFIWLDGSINLNELKEMKYEPNSISSG
jgi:hypothetical protein